MDTEIKEAEEKDIDECFILAQAKELEFGPNEFPTKEELKSGFTSGIGLVAKDGDKIIGFVLGYILTRQNGYIDLLVVSKDYRGKGIGTKLLDEITAKMRAKSVNFVWLLTREIDENLDFYLKKRFNEGDRFRLFWKDI